MATSSSSYTGHSVWRRFTQRRVPLIAAILLVTLLALSAVANLYVYDHTPGADLQHPTLSLKPPGFSTEVLRVSKRKTVPTPWWTRLLYGHEKAYEEVPYRSIGQQQADVLPYVDHYGRSQFIPVNRLMSAPGDHQVVFLLGTDRFGRSLLSRLLRGIRISFIVGGIAVVISLTIGIFMGLLGGYFGGWVDSIILFVINVTWSIPTLVMVFAIVLLLGRGLGAIFIAVGLTMWVDVARIVRGQAISLKNAPFVVAEKSMGVGHIAIMLRHVLPNIMGPILVIAVANFATAILVEAGLSYIGFGINPPHPSLGNILNEHYGYAVTGKIGLALIPAITIMLLVLSFNLVGMGLRDAFDVKD